MKTYRVTGKFTATKEIEAEGPSQAAEIYVLRYAACNGAVWVRLNDKQWFFDVGYKTIPVITLKLDRSRSAI